VEARRNARASGDVTSALILQGLGGKNNISDLDACATRLRVTVKNPSHVNESMLKRSGASGVIKKGDGVQIIYGPRVSVIRSSLEDFMDSPDAQRTDEIIAYGSEDKKGPSDKASDSVTLTSPMIGEAVHLSAVSDKVFAEGMLGKGMAIEPSEGRLYAPCDGVIENIAQTKHAVNMRGEGDAEILLHIGIDTVKLGGEHFTVHTANGQQVKRGELLVSFDMEAIAAKGYALTSPMIVTNSDSYSDVKQLATGKATCGKDVLRLTAPKE